MRNQIATVLITIAAALSWTVESHGQQSAYDVIDQSCNANGYVLTPKPGAAKRFPDGALLKAKTYLGKSCDAFNQTLGSGVWCWANGGLNVEFGGQAYGLARMELYCEHPGLNVGGQDCSCGTRPLPSWK